MIHLQVHTPSAADQGDHGLLTELWLRRLDEGLS